MSMSPSYQHRGRLITAASLVVVGLIWIGQGLGVLRSSSFKTDKPFWAAAGAVFVVAGAALALIEWRHPRPDA